MLSVLLVSRCPLVLADMIVLVITWMKTWRKWREAMHLNSPFSVTTCLLRDGERLALLPVLCVNM